MVGRACDLNAPRLKKLYLGRVIKEHNLLQALTRVNRPYKKMRYGYVVDFADIRAAFDGSTVTEENELLVGTRISYGRKSLCLELAVVYVDERSRRADAQVTRGWGIVGDIDELLLGTRVRKDIAVKCGGLELTVVYVDRCVA